MWYILSECQPWASSSFKSVSQLHYNSLRPNSPSKTHQLQLDSCWVTKDVHLEAPHYNDSLIGSSLQSGIREVFYLRVLGKYSEGWGLFRYKWLVVLTGAVIAELNPLEEMSLKWEEWKNGGRFSEFTSSRFLHTSALWWYNSPEEREREGLAAVCIDCFAKSLLASYHPNSCGLKEQVRPSSSSV